LKGELDADKQAAYATLHEVLATVTRVLAPFIPHVADALWQNLVVAVDPAAPDSVHLSDFPASRGRADADVDRAVALARRVVSLGRAARAASELRTRQPLRRLRVRLPGGLTAFSTDPALAAELEAQVRDELNVKIVEPIADDSALVERALYPLLPVVGPRHGADVGRIMAAIRAGDWSLTDDGGAVAGGVSLAPDEFTLTARARAGHEIADEGDLLVALDTEVDAELAAEGLAREVAHRLQNLRKAAGLEISDRIEVAIRAEADLAGRLEPHRSWLADETLATRLVIGPDAEFDEAAAADDTAVDGAELRLMLRRAG
jgi:isoleucyl-tRNA synthetase